AVPLLWIIPLALYVGTFIIVFARSYRLPMNKLLTTHAVLLVLAIASFAYPYIPSKIILIPLHFLLFFISALVCHQALADARPPAARLTEFYLIMSLGGVMGGILNALIAPVAFVFPIEYALALGAVCFVRYAGRQKNLKDSIITELHTNWWILGAVVVFGLMTLALPESKGFLIFCIAVIALLMLAYSNKRFTFALSACVMLTLYPGFNWLSKEKLVFADRNFFGVSRIYDTASNQMRFYLHGVTMHGAQMLTDKYRLTPISYYNEKASVGDIFRMLDRRGGKQNVAVLGLGIGTLDCYRHKGRHFDMFEIDPDVQRIAEDRNLFTFLSDCNSPYDIILGDGRLQIEKMPDRHYDAIVLDAFSSDNIPIHIITKEAFQIYLKKLKPGGIIIANISNNFLDLTPPLDSLARDLDMTAIFKLSLAERVGDTNINYAPSIFSVLAPDAKNLKPLLSIPGWRPYDGDHHPRVWTDNYASMIRAFWPKGKPEVCKEGEVAYRCNAQNRKNKTPH
ncbi:MAG TPA: fused MFS/spermidine synthase, partial [Alphaproteobacteria bacterium]